MSTYAAKISALQQIRYLAWLKFVVLVFAGTSYILLRAPDRPQHAYLSCAFLTQIDHLAPSLVMEARAASVEVVLIVRQLTLC